MMGYMRGIDCLHHDWLLIGCLIALNTLICAGYWIIASDWFRHARKTPDSGGKRGLTQLIWIFLLCGVCGYLLPTVMLFWPVWWVMVAVKAFLVVVTWFYVFGTRGMWIIFREMGAEARLKVRIVAAIDDIKRQPLESRNLENALDRIRLVMQEDAA